jgi:hypothetical protein
MHQEVTQGEVWASLGAEVLQSRAPPAAALWQREQRVVRVAGPRSLFPPIGGVSGPPKRSGTGDAS